MPTATYFGILMLFYNNRSIFYRPGKSLCRTSCSQFRSEYLRLGPDSITCHERAFLERSDLFLLRALYCTEKLTDKIFLFLRRRKIFLFLRRRKILYKAMLACNLTFRFSVCGCSRLGSYTSIWLHFLVELRQPAATRHARSRVYARTRRLRLSQLLNCLFCGFLFSTAYGKFIDVLIKHIPG